MLDVAPMLATALDVSLNDIPTLQDKDMKLEQNESRPKHSYCLRALRTQHSKKTVLHDIILLGLLADSPRTETERWEHAQEVSFECLALFFFLLRWRLIFFGSFSFGSSGMTTPN